MASKTPFFHMCKRHVLLGMAENTNQALQPADIVSIVVQEVKAILGIEDVSPSLQLISLGLDSFSFVSTFYDLALHRTNVHDCKEHITFNEANTDLPVLIVC